MSGSPQPTAHSSRAPVNTIPADDYFVVEYPGYVKNPQRILATLGGLDAVSKAYNVETKSLDLRYRPGDPFSHAIEGEVCPTSNLLLKVTRTVRRRKQPPPNDTLQAGTLSRSDDPDEETTKFDAHICGFVRRTVRYRSLADFQVVSAINDPLVQFKRSIDVLDMEAIRKFALPNPADDSQPQSHQLFSAVFCRSNQPFAYQYRQQSGMERSYMPKFKDQPLVPMITHPQSIASRNYIVVMSKDHVVPAGPTTEILKQREQLSQVALDQIHKYFHEYPIHSRRSVMTRLESYLESQGLVLYRVIPNEPKALLAQSAYTIQGGPFQHAWVRYGYDPRTNPSARWSQMIAYQQSTLRGKKQDHIYAHRENEYNRSRDPTIIHIPFMDRIVQEKDKYMFFEYRNIQIPHIQRLLRRPRAILPSYNSRLGWIPTDVAVYVRQYVHARLVAFFHGQPSPHPIVDDQETDDTTKEDQILEQILQADVADRSTGHQKPTNAATTSATASMEQRINAKVDELMRTLEQADDQLDNIDTGYEEPDDDGMGFGSLDDIYGDDSEDDHLTMADATKEPTPQPTVAPEAKAPTDPIEPELGPSLTRNLRPDQLPRGKLNNYDYQAMRRHHVRGEDRLPGKCNTQLNDLLIEVMEWGNYKAEYAQAYWRCITTDDGWLHRFERPKNP
ncbi:tau 95 subunit of transcription factor TFIIIC [Dimargaris verticillata]|uniref:Tau 95 subunit of transcription factor TFIIIC n=1 Tax=Dimargaris verticillata TaxID=2761393 RepID=A0A9W8BAE7_9FUNG|nr:tau 95 subunit of transcription factor TFIIIC [Dimargaris verticillata]